MSKADLCIGSLAAIQERNRSVGLSAMICNHPGYAIYRDSDTYPDGFHQRLEAKLQTSPMMFMVDLGLHSPEDNSTLMSFDSTTFYSKDIRYVIFTGEVFGDRVLPKNLYYKLPVKTS